MQTNTTARPRRGQLRAVGRKPAQPAASWCSYPCGSRRIIKPRRARPPCCCWPPTPTTFPLTQAQTILVFSHRQKRCSTSAISALSQNWQYGSGFNLILKSLSGTGSLLCTSKYSTPLAVTSTTTLCNLVHTVPYSRSLALATFGVGKEDVIKKIISVREKVYAILKDWRWITYQSGANFLFTQPIDFNGSTGKEVAEKLYRFLNSKNVFVHYQLFTQQKITIKCAFKHTFFYFMWIKSIKQPTFQTIKHQKQRQLLGI